MLWRQATGLLRKRKKMEKPKKSIFVYLIGIYLFLTSSVLTAPFRQRSIEYFSTTGIPDYSSNWIMMIISIFAIVLIIQIIRYKKVFFFIGAGWFILSSIWILYLIFFLYKKYFTWIDFVAIINILCILFLLNKNSLNRCNEYSEYYRILKEQKEMRKRLK